MRENRFPFNFPLFPARWSPQSLLGKLSCALILIVCAVPALAEPRTKSPTEFFKEVSSRLLRSEFALRWDRIGVYPTNQYNPAVHRLLQFTANLYDATTNRADLTGYPFLPSVFRPLFRRDTAGAIFIAGYREVADARLAEPGGVAPVDLASAADRDRVPLAGTPFDPDDQLEPLVYGVPLVVGARKGFPNFNEFALQNAVQVMRRLQFRRGVSSDDPSLIVETNQMYVVGMANVLGVEAWNSYSNAFPRDLQMTAIAELQRSLVDESGNVLYTNQYAVGDQTLIPANTWPGFAGDQWIRPPSIRIALTWSNEAIPSSTWRPANSPQLVPLSSDFDRTGLYPVPRWRLSIAERVRFFLVDTTVTPHRIVDYVNLSRTEKVLDLADCLQNMAGGAGPANRVMLDGSGNPWATNRFQTANALDLRFPTYGIHNQIARNGTRLGPFTGIPRYVLDASVNTNFEYVIDFFRYQFVPPEYSFIPLFRENIGRTFYLTNVFYTPLVPLGAIYTHVSWQANDPLVHHMVEDLIARQWWTNITTFSHNPPLHNLGLVNQQYEPWSDASQPRNPHLDPEARTLTDLSVKDPLVRRSDDWDFPGNKAPGFGWLSRIHRGTPWQTVYLKSAGDPASWANWMAGYDPGVAQAMHPTNDWRLPTLLSRLLNTRGRFDPVSVNESDPNVWKGLLNGLIVLTNTSSLMDVCFGQPPLFQSLIMTSNSPQAEAIAGAIASVRGSRPGGYFQDVGDLLAVPELSAASPWLNRGGLEEPYPSCQITSGISEEAYEILPTQLLSLVRADSFGWVVSTNGQTLVQFTGDDRYFYVIERSMNLKHWLPVSVKRPREGVFSLRIPTRLRPGQQFYRSVRLERKRPIVSEFWSFGVSE